MPYVQNLAVRAERVEKNYIRPIFPLLGAKLLYNVLLLVHPSDNPSVRASICLFVFSLKKRCEGNVNFSANIQDTRLNSQVKI